MLERKDINLFDSVCLREALLNAFIHNDWVDLNAQMISIFEDRIEILSYGGLPSKLTKVGFLAGKSKPRCIELAEIFLQLRISERSGRGVPKIIGKYGKESIKIEKNRIIVTIPFNKINVNSFEIVDKKVDKKVYQKLNKSQVIIITAIRNNLNITVNQLMIESNLSE